MNRFGYAVLMMTLAYAPSLGAQESGTRGFFLGGGVNATSIDLNEEDLDEAVDAEGDQGGGITIVAGYNFNQNLGISLSASAANIDSGNDEDYTLALADLSLRYSLANPSRAFIPYFELGLTGLSAQDDDNDEIELTGGGVTLAAGINYFVTQKLAFDLNLRGTAGEFDTVRFGDVELSTDDGVGVTVGRVNLGLTWYPQGGN